MGAIRPPHPHCIAFQTASKGCLRIDTRTNQALARGNLVSLALLAFFAVFREGGETTVFYLGMAPSIAVGDLLLGLGIGVGALLVAALGMLIAGIKLPLQPFFCVAWLLAYYLGFKFVGTGVHALQVADVLPTSRILGALTVPLFGIYPSWETMLPPSWQFIRTTSTILVGTKDAW